MINNVAACWFFFFCNDLFENMLLVCCVYATNTLLQISLGQAVLVLIFFLYATSPKYTASTVLKCC